MSLCPWFPFEVKFHKLGNAYAFSPAVVSSFLSAAVTAVSFPSEVQGLRPGGRRGRPAHRPPGREGPPGFTWTPSAVAGAAARQHPHRRWSLSPQGGGHENSFRSGPFMTFPCFPPLQDLPRPARGADSRFFRLRPARCRPTWTRGGGGSAFADGAGAQRVPEGPPFSGESFAQVQSPQKEGLGLCGPKSTWTERQPRSPD